MLNETAVGKFDSARKAGEAFLGVEVAWNMGDQATDLAIPRGQFEELFMSVTRRKDFFKAITAEDSLTVAARLGWSLQLKIDPRTVTVKQLSKPDKDTPLAFGVYYRVSLEGERDKWELGARVRVNDGQVVVCPPADETEYPNESARRWADAMAVYANDCFNTAFNYHISHALLDLGDELGWVSRRVSGGVYFLPGDSGEKFTLVLDGLAALTNEKPVQFEGSSIPQYADPRTLSTWKRRTEQTFESEFDQLSSKLEDMVSRDNVRESSFDTKVFECSELLTKADHYANILQEKLGPLKSKIDALKVKFAEAKASLQESKSKADQAFGAVAQAAQGAKAAPTVVKPAKPAKPAGPVSVRSKDELMALFAI
jgi:hypothetical protein